MRWACCLSVALFAAGCAPRAKSSSKVAVLIEPSESMIVHDDPEIRLNQKASTVDVVGLGADDLAALKRIRKPEEWTPLFAVYVHKEGARGRNQPAVLGSYRVEDGVLRFRPRFPLARGVRYRAVFDPSRLPAHPDVKPLETTLLIPKPKPAAATVVEHVYPSKDVLPENQLKFYLHFSAPMSRGEAYQRVHLLDAKGKAIELPFLELDEELWDGSGKRFTLFFDPGRIKRGLKPREEMGPALEEGKRYTLVIERAWADAEGNPLKQTYRKSFRVGPPDDTPPDPRTWKLQPPAAGSKSPLMVRFPKAMDHALLHRMLWVTDAKGRRVAGKVHVSDEETCWRFTPEKPWAAGSYQLVADKEMEDLAGNSIGRPFEVDVFRPVRREVKTETVTIPFTVPPARPSR